MSVRLQTNETSAAPRLSHERPASDALRGWALRNVILPATDAAMGHPMVRRLRFLERAQWWDPERLRARRNELLAHVIRTAYAEVPFYRDWMDGAGVRPEEIRRAEDLTRIPVVGKKDLRAHYPERTVRRTSHATFEVHTTGSTGSGFAVMEDNETAGWYRASFLLAAEWAGWHVGDAHLQSGMALHRSGIKALKDRVMGCAYIAANILTDEAMDRALTILEAEHIRHVWGYPFFVYILARRARERGWSRQMTSIVTWGDTLYPQHRSLVENVFGTRVTDTYGCSEGFQASAQCSHGTYHTHDLDVILEYLDEDDRPVPPGATGQIAVTRLHPGPMPLIRCRVGDMGVAENGAGCACGRGFGTMTGLQGRISDCVLTPDGNRLVIHFFCGIFRDFADVESFQIVQETADRLRVYVVPMPEFLPSTPAFIAGRLRDYGLTGMDVIVEPVAGIPPTAGGKRRVVINRLLESPVALEPAAVRSIRPGSNSEGRI